MFYVIISDGMCTLDNGIHLNTYCECVCVCVCEYVCVCMCVCTTNMKYI